MCGVVILAAHALLWSWLDRSIEPPDIAGRLASLSYTTETVSPGVVFPVDAARIDAELAMLSRITRSIRTYSATRGMQVVPALAAKHGLSVTLGAWIGVDYARNAREINAALDVARTHTNVRSIVIGNETLLRKELGVDALLSLLRQTKARTTLPITTAEPWHVWLDNPRLAETADYIAAHALPYWEGMRHTEAVSYVRKAHRRLRQAFPGKRIVIAEFGWPSNGNNRNAAVPGRLEQASVLRNFIADARRRGIEYNLIEAFDQPWKTAEGSVGPYWGLIDVSGDAKFPLTGPVRTGQPGTGWLALTLAIFLSGAILLTQRIALGHAIAMALVATAAAAGAAIAIGHPATAYLGAGQTIVWAVGLILLIPLLAASLIRANEMAQDLIGFRSKRLLRPGIRPKAQSAWPRVSIHVPACREPPALVAACLDSLARLDYPDFEVLVVVNNTSDASLWKPVRAHCRSLGQRFRFFQLPRVNGHKAGALTAALEASDPDAEIIAVVDADYRVQRRWLRDLVPSFIDPAVALIQAPQDHTVTGLHPAHRMMNDEYAGFFDIGMIQRNEANAIIAHGTMLLLRRRALRAVGGWATDTIVEDTELGLRLLARGFQAHYTNRRYGHGVLPDDLGAYRRQRRRWAHGAMQILRKHWRLLLPWRRALAPAQKWHFAVGWMTWISDAAAVALAALNLAAAPLMAAGLIAFPPASLVLPMLAAFLVGSLHTALLYRRRVTRSYARIIAAAISASSLQLTVARAVLSGLFGRSLSFDRTDKGGPPPRSRKFAAIPEALLGLSLAGAATLFSLINPHDVLEQNLFAALLALQSLPHLSALAMAAAEYMAMRRRLENPTPSWRPARPYRPAPQS